MEKIYRVGKSNTPTLRQMEKIIKSLNVITKSSVRIEIAQWSHVSRSNVDKPEFSLSFLPGLNGKECSIHQFKSWSRLLKFYFIYKKTNWKS